MATKSTSGALVVMKNTPGALEVKIPLGVPRGFAEPSTPFTPSITFDNFDTFDNLLSPDRLVARPDPYRLLPAA